MRREQYRLKYSEGLDDYEKREDDTVKISATLSTKHLVYLLLFSIVLGSLYFAGNYQGAPIGAIVIPSNGILSCDVEDSTTCSVGTKIFAIAAHNNSHAELPNETNYGVSICCQDTSGNNTIGTSSSGTALLNFGSSTNAHVELSNETNFGLQAFISASNGFLNCTADEVSGSCTGGKTCLATIANGTNAHAGNCTSGYSTTLCCGFDTLATFYIAPTAPIASDLTANGSINGTLVEGEPTYPTQTITFTNDTTGRRVFEISGAFNQSDVDVENLTIQTNGTATAVNTSLTAGVDVIHSIFLDFTGTSNSGVRVCPQAQLLLEINDSCPGKLIFEGPFPETQSNITVSVESTEYRVANLTTSGAELLAVEIAMACPVTITTDTIVNSTLTATESCVTFGANNITLDCQGNDIIFGESGSDNSHGAIAEDRSGVSVEDCNFIKNTAQGNDTFGVFFNRINDSLVMNNTFLGNGSNRSDAVVVNQGINVTVTNNTASLTGTGFGNNWQSSAIRFNNTHNSTMTSNVIRSNQSSSVTGGIDLAFGSSDNNLSNNTMFFSNDGQNFPVSLSEASSYNLIERNSLELNSTGNFNWALELIEGSNFNIVRANNFTMFGPDRTIGLRAENDVSDNLYDQNRVYINSTSDRVFGITANHDAQNNTFSNNFINVSGTTTNVHGLRAGDQSNNNTFINNTLYVNGGFGVLAGTGGGAVGANKYINNTFANVTNWISSTQNSGPLNFTNSTFVMADGQITLDNFTVGATLDINKTDLNITSNRAFVNSTKIPTINTTGTVQLLSVPDTNPGPIVDFLDENSFTTCNPPQCTNVIKSGSDISFDVASFTTYSSQTEGLVTTCPFTITNNSIINTTLAASGSCITFGSSNISLDCQGNTIIFGESGDDESHAIIAREKEGVAVRNCHFVKNTALGNNTFGVNFDRINDSIVVNNTFLANGSNRSDAVVVNLGSNVTVSNNTIALTGTGFGSDWRASAIRFNNTQNSSMVDNLIRSLQVDISTNGLDIANGGGDNNLTNNSLSFEADGSNFMITVSEASSYNTIEKNDVFVNATDNFNWALEIIEGSNFNIIRANNFTMFGPDRTIGLRAENDVSDNLYDQNRVYINSTADRVFGITANHDAQNNTFSNNFINVTGTSNTQGLRVGDAANNNTFINNTLYVNGGFGVIAGTGGGAVGANTYINNTLSNVTQWISNTQNSGPLNFTNTTFVMENGFITLDNFTLGATVDINKTELNITQNLAFINSTSVPSINTSGRVVLQNLLLLDARPTVDFEDDGSFDLCDPPQCFDDNFAGSTLTFNVSSFTTYSSIERPTEFNFTKTDSPDPLDVNVSNQFTYNITVNVTEGTAINTSITDNLPTGTSLVSSQPAPNTAANNTWDIGNVTNGTIFVLNITVQVDTGFNNGTVLNNTANITVFNATAGALMANASANTTLLTTVFDSNVTNSTVNNSTKINSTVANSTNLNCTVANSTETGSTCSGGNLTNSTMTNSTVIDTNLTNSTATNTTKNGSVAINSTNIGCNVQNSTELNASCTNSNLTNTTVIDSNVTDTNMTNSTATNTTKTGSTVLNSTNTNCLVSNSNETGVECTDSNITDSTLTDTNITNSTSTNSTKIQSTVANSSNTNCLVNQSTEINATCTNSTVTNSTKVNVTIITSTNIDCTAANSNETGSNCTASQLENSSLIDSNVTNSSVVNSTKSGSIVESSIDIDCTVTDSLEQNVQCQDSTIGDSTVIDMNVTNSSIANSTKINSTVANSTNSACTVTQSTEINVNCTGSTITNSTKINSTITTTVNTGCLAQGSTETASTCTDSQIINSTLNNATSTNSNITNSTKTNSVIINSTVENSNNTGCTIINGVEINSTCTNSEINNSVIINSTLIQNMIIVNSTVLNDICVNGTIIFGTQVFPCPVALNTIVNPLVTSGGGGGATRSGSGGGGGGGIAPKVVVMDSDTLITPPLRRLDKVLFTINNEQHSLTISRVQMDSVTLTFTSEPQDVVLTKGTWKLVDVNYDGTPDMRVELLTLQSPIVVLNLIKQSQTVPQPITFNIPPKPAPTPEPEPEPVQEAEQINKEPVLVAEPSEPSKLSQMLEKTKQSIKSLELTSENLVFGGLSLLVLVLFILTVKAIKKPHKQGSHKKRKKAVKEVKVIPRGPKASLFKKKKYDFSRAEKDLAEIKQLLKKYKKK